jgi:serine/threonine-protein kinase
VVTSDPLIGMLVAERYRVISMIGEGGMGRVYLAEQQMGTATRKVAIKVLTGSLGDSLAVARFYRECETVVQLSHPNTIRFYDFGRIEIPLANGSSESQLFIAMEFIEGRSLARVIEEGPLPLETIDRLLTQISGALTEAHRRGIVHRDLKPDNVLLTKDIDGFEFAKVCDFGIAKQERTAGPEITEQGTIIGTPAYMSPEQITGLEVDERSDVYALALITYEMLAGARAFVARTPLEWATAHLTMEPRPFEDFPTTRSLSIERRAAIRRALSKDVKDRTPSVKAFAQEFCNVGPRANESFLPKARASESPLRDQDAFDPTVAATPGAVSRAAHLPTEYRFKWSFVFGAFALLGAGAASVWFAMRPIDPMALPVEQASDAGVAETVLDAGDPTMPREWSNILQFEDRATNATLALGPPDGRCARIAPSGTIHVELTPGSRMTTDGTDAPDVRVIVLEGSVAYRVDIGVERRQFTTVAQGLIGSTPLDIDQYDLSRFRYIRVKNRERTGEVCVDAIGTFAHPTP